MLLATRVRATEEQRDEPPGAMGKRQDDKGQGHEILPGNAVMPVPLTARPNVVF